MKPYEVQQALLVHGNHLMSLEQRVSRLEIGHPAETTVEPEQPTDKKMRTAWGILARLVELKDGPRDERYEREKPQVWDMARVVLESADVTEEQPLDVEAWKARAVEALSPVKWDYTVTWAKRQAEALVEANLHLGAERPPPFDRDEAEAHVTREMWRAFSTADGTEVTFDLTAAGRIVEYFSGLVANAMPLGRERVGDAVYSWDPSLTEGAHDSLVDVVMALLPSTDKDDNDE